LSAGADIIESEVLGDDAAPAIGAELNSSHLLKIIAQPLF
jgi:hypothetical protein